MFENLMFAIRDEYRNGKRVDTCFITPAQYEHDFFKNLYYREVNGNRRYHRCEYANTHRNFQRYLAWETYGNGYKCEWTLVAIPESAEFRERDVIEHMTHLEHYMDGDHELVKFHAAVPNGDEYEHRTCIWDVTYGKFIG